MVPSRWPLAAAIAVFVASAWPTLPSTVDDAWISMRYARHLGEGHGLVYNAGEPPVEGYTNFLWVILGVPGTIAPFHPAWWLTGLGLAFGVVAIVCVEGLGRALGGGAWAVVPAIVLAGLPHFAIASTNGLETSLFVAAVLGAAWAACARPGLGSGMLAGALYLVRPEGLAVGAALSLGHRRSVAGFAAVAIPYFLGRWLWFDTLVPNTFRAQARKPFLEMWSMNESYFARSPALWVGALLLAALALALPPYRGRRVVVLAIAGGLTLLALRVYNWMPGGRLLLAPLALVLASLAPVLARAPRGTVILLGWTSWLSLGPSRTAETRYDAIHSVLPGGEGERMGREIAARSPAGSWLLSRDGGFLPYFAGTGVRVLDTHDHSLTEPRLTGADFDLDFVLGRDVALIVTTTMEEDDFPSSYARERRLLRDSRVAESFRHVRTARQHHRRFFHLWVRDDVAFDTEPP